MHVAMKLDSSRWSGALIQANTRKPIIHRLIPTRLTPTWHNSMKLPEATWPMEYPKESAPWPTAKMMPERRRNAKGETRDE
jgi:hypothetical protein